MSDRTAAEPRRNLEPCDETHCNRAGHRPRIASEVNVVAVVVVAAAFVLRTRKEDWPGVTDETAVVVAGNDHLRA